MAVESALPLSGSPGKVSRSIDGWTSATKRVTGPFNALYLEPSSSPLYTYTSAKLEDAGVRGRVARHLRRGQRGLRRHWLRLAIKFVARER